jgi:hypothetical protein
MGINSLKKSSRLLQSRRYTHDSFTDAQEAFTSVLDINAAEVYTDQNLIPSASLPFSGSSQNGSIYSSGGKQVMKYYYRLAMTRSDLVSGSASEVWFLLSPSGSNAGVNAQLIETNQQNNFISPKYSVPALTNANAEDITPGYGAKVFVSSATSSAGVVAGDQVSINNYTFDYKNGVLQFTSNAVSATTSQYVYISAYQYVGRTLASNDTLGYSGSFSGSFFGSGAGLTNISASNIVGLNLFSISTGSVTASVNTNTNRLFLINSGSNNYLNISASSHTTLSSDLFIIKNFTTQQPVLIVSESVVQIVTHSVAPTGSTNAGNFWFTANDLFIGLD